MWFFLACLTKPVTLPKSHLDVQQIEEQYDWNAISKEATQILQAYIQTDTTNPPGNETRGAFYLADLLSQEGIPAQIIESSPGRGNLIARIEGSGKDKPLCLLSHIDTVTYEAEQWQHPPLSGHVDDEGYIWGRGALDMKSMGVMELMSMVLLHRNKIPLKRDIVLIAVADEENGGEGMQFLVEHHWDKLECGQLINEGGLGLKDAIFKGQNIFPISVGEKGSLWLKMLAKGPSGHGSTPRPGEATEKLLLAIDRLRQHKIKTTIDPVLGTFLANVGAQKQGVTAFVTAQPFLRDILVKPKLEANPLTKAAMMNTIHMTGFGGHHRPNVVASEVFVQLDCRLLPGVTPQEFLLEIQDIVGGEVELEVLHQQEGNQSPIDDPLFYALSRYATLGESSAVSGPVISVGFTDSIYVRPKGTHAYGFVPVLLDAQEMQGFHGVDERISQHNLLMGTKKLFSAILEVSVDTNPQ